MLSRAMPPYYNYTQTPGSNNHPTSHAYTSSTNFLLGSSSSTSNTYDQCHEANAIPGPSHSQPFSDATGMNPSVSASHYSYPYSSQAWPPQPVFPTQDVSYTYSTNPTDLPHSAYLHKQPSDPWQPSLASTSSNSPPILSAFEQSISSGSMAIPPLFGSTHPVQTVVEPLPQPPAHTDSDSGKVSSVPNNSIIQGSPPPPASADEASGTSSKEGKKNSHPCWMCYKSFDRPSTLKKHFLVHTGEKAFQCETCGRRFGVASNLSRHAKRCVLRPVHGAAAAARISGGASPGSPTASSPTGSTVDPTNPVEAANTPSFSISNDQPERGTATFARVAARRQRPSVSSASDAPSPGSTVNADSSSPTTTAATTPARPKPRRRRRAPSPSRWVPDSLKLFDLTPLPKATPVPLPPVQPYHDPRTRTWEERDSFDDSLSETATPYHPIGWKGKLPGPGLIKSESMGMGGTLLVF